MKHILFILLLLVVCFTACKHKTEEDLAQEMIEGIEISVSQGDYRSALDSITVLRARYPKAINARKRALDLWQVASRQQAEHDVAATQELLDETLKAIEEAPTLLEQNLLRDKRDSLQARLDASEGILRVIDEKMKESQNE